MTPLVSQLLSIFLFIVLGFLGGAIVATLWFEREQRKEEAEPKANQPLSDRAFVPANPPETETEAAVVHTGQHTEITLLRDDSSGRLLTQDNQRQITSAAELTSPERQKLLWLAAEWMAWLGAVENPAGQIPATYNPGTKPTQAELATTPPVAVVPPPSLAEGAPPSTVAAPPPPPPAVPPPPVLASTRATLKVAAKPGKENAEAKPAAPTSIVAQIDEVLQAMLDKAPEGLPKIRLTEDPIVGVLVWIGAEHYNGIDGVPDPSVKELIRSAVKEWENRADRSRA